MARSFSTIVVLALFVVCVSGGLDGESREGWFPGPAGETKPVSPTIIGISGAIFCQKSGRVTPIQGAYAKVKGFLHSSPLESCEVATDVNQGITGAPLKSYKSFPEQHMKVFSVGPFIYT